MLEAGGLAVALTAVAALVYGPHAVHGGFISDAWTWRAVYEFAPGDGFLQSTQYLMDQPNMEARPLYAIYLSLLNAAFGPHMGFWLGFSVALGVVMSICVFLLLRELTIPPLDAAAIAVLVLLFPASSSLRFWAATPGSQLTIALVALGFVAALRGFAARGRTRLVLHGVSLALFVTSVLLYEIALGVLLASVLVYRLCVPWRAAVSRWLVDCAVLVPLAVLAATRSPEDFFPRQDSQGIWNHVTLIWEQARTLLTTVVLPFGSDSWYVVALLALVPATAALVAARLPPSDPARAALRRSLIVVAGGLAVVILGYAVFVPTLDTYSPMAPGIFDRVNALPSVGWSLLVYGLIMLAAKLACRGLPDAPRLTSGLAAVTCAIVVASWLGTLADDADGYTRAYEKSQRVLDTVRRTVPEPAANSTIWTFGQPAELDTGYTVFAGYWEMTDAVRLAYDDPTLASYVGYPGTTFQCEAREIVPRGHVYYDSPGELYKGTDWYVRSFASAYGSTYFVDTRADRAERIDTPTQCRRASRSFPRA